ncbi:MAG: hypothetical protein ABL876_19115 [Chitinophagaceae bacterium]
MFDDLVNWQPTEQQLAKLEDRLKGKPEKLKTVKQRLQGVLTKNHHNISRTLWPVFLDLITEISNVIEEQAND